MGAYFVDPLSPRREAGVDVYSRITAQIVEYLEKGVRPWTRSWNAEHAAGRITRPLRFNGQPIPESMFCPSGCLLSARASPRRSGWPTARPVNWTRMSAKVAFAVRLFHSLHLAGFDADCTACPASCGGASTLPTASGWRFDTSSPIGNCRATLGICWDTCWKQATSGTAGA